jgi:tetraacyldisaccharide 4'-kinase
MIRPRPRRDRWRAALRPLSWVYAGVLRVRNARFDQPGASRAAGVPVISIGNITLGGTGKTPLVIEVVRRLQALGRRPAILTRGYGTPRGSVPDEVQEFQAAVPDVPVVVQPDRVAGAALARARHGADVLVLDDGFQHRRLARGLDIVLIDALDPWGGGFTLPAGRLREPLEGLRRAQLIVIARANQVAAGGDSPAVALARLEARLALLAPAAPRLRADVVPTAVVDADGRTAEPATLAGRVVQPVCALGNPATFVQALEALGARPRQVIAFRDHHWYTAAEARVLAAAARARTAELVVTTRKDWGKLLPVWPHAADAPPLMRLDVRTELHDAAELLTAALRRAIGAA